MLYAIVTGGAVSAYGPLPSLFPNVSFPVGGPDDEWLAENGAVLVIQHPSSYDDTKEKVCPVAPFMGADGAVISYEITPLTPEELAQRKEDLSVMVRADRDRRLSASDWTQLPDVPVTTAKQAAWAAYRQELREITAQAGFPESVVWPEPPAD